MKYLFKCDVLLPQNHLDGMSNLHEQVTEIMRASALHLTPERLLLFYRRDLNTVPLTTSDVPI